MIDKTPSSAGGVFILSHYATTPKETEEGMFYTMDDLMKRQLLVELKRIGYHEAYYSQEHDAVFPMDKAFPDIRLHTNKIWMQRVESLPGVDSQPEAVKEKLDKNQRDLVYKVFLPLTNKVDEISYAWRNSASIKLRDIQHYRLLSEYGKIMFAARDDGEHGLHFVTWEYDYDRAGVGHGHYTTDYTGAKLDFAVRAGMMPEKLLFEKEELRQMHSALIFQGKIDDTMTFAQERDLYDVIQKLEEMAPELRSIQELPVMENESEPEQ